MNRNLSFEKKAQQVLELGKKYLGVNNGHLTKIDPQTDHWEAVSSTDSEGPFSPGQIYDLRTTYCRRTLQQDTSIALHDAPAQGWADDPAFETHGLACYHGTEITIDDETYGAVCFVSESAREPFTAAETMFAEIIACKLEHELERHKHENELTRQSNLSTVLNRVLRHNLRNSLTVIRGRAEQIAEQFPAASATQSLVDQTDRLIELSEKARVLESVVAEEHDPQKTSIRSLLDRVIHDIAADFPDASITVQGTNDIIFSAKPSLKRALHELIENAAKHTGDAPTVTISVETVPNAIRIRIDDDGPGLAEIEQQVLTEGTETPLEHGSGLGLWLAYWIVTSHDGTIDATVEDGTCMIIELPRNTTTTAQDAHKRDEPTLQRVQDKFRAVFDEASDAILIADDDGQYIDANERAADLFGLPRPALLGRSIREFVPSDLDFEETWTEFQATDRDRGMITIINANGTERMVEYSAETNIIPGQHLSILRDVTEREKQKEEIELAETVFQNTQEAIFLINVVKADEFRVQRVNNAYEELTGLTNADIQGKTPREIVDDEIGAQIEAQYSRCVERQETIQYPEEIPVDGVQRHWETKLTPIIEDGEVVKLVGAMRDVTARRERTDELSRLETALETVLSNVPVAFWTTDDAGRFTRSHGGSLAKLGLEAGEAVGDSLFDVFDDHPDIKTQAAKALDGDAVTATNTVGDGVFETWFRPVRGDDGALVGTAGLAYDVTDHDRRPEDHEG